MTEYENEILANKKAIQLLQRIDEGKGSFKELYEFTKIIGRIAADCIAHKLESECPNGNVNGDDVRRIVSPILRQNHKIVSDATAAVQDEQSKRSGVGLKAMNPKYNTRREYGLVNELSRRSRSNELGG